VLILPTKMQQSKSFIPLQHKELSKDEFESALNDFFELCNSRRSVRTFSNKEVPQKIVEAIIKTAGSAPSGAHKQP
tara:strand:- start:9373 stop:9600 length:228 start_codon:yes stop_codon:yes gene_type:complete